MRTVLVSPIVVCAIALAAGGSSCIPALPELPDASFPDPSDGDDTAPEFAGVSSVATAGPTQLAVRWAAAEDDKSSPSRINYRVFVAESAGGHDYAGPFTTVTGATAVTLWGLSRETTYHIVVRAADEAGNVEENTVERSGRTLGDASPLPPVSSLDLAGAPQASVVSGGALFLALGQEGLQILELRDPTSPTPLATLNVGADAIGVAADRIGGLAALLLADGRVVSVDVSDPSAPASLGALSSVSGASAVAVAGRFVVVSAGAQLSLYRLDVGADPALVSTLALDDDVTALTAFGRSAWAALADGTLVEIDLIAGVVGRSISLGGAASTLAAVAGRVAAVVGDQVFLIDTRGATLTLAGTLEVSGVAFLALGDGVIIVGIVGGQVETWDVSDASAPILLGVELSDGLSWLGVVEGVAAFGSAASGSIVNLPPVVVSRTPAAGGSFVRGGSVEVLFNEPVLTGTARLLLHIDDEAVPGSAVLIDGGRRLVFRPAAGSLSPGDVVRVRLAAGLRDLLGGLLSMAVDYTFTVSDAPVCTATSEVCDGVDNDCDGMPDEGACGLAENPTSAYPHSVDGVFTDWEAGLAAPYEWFDIRPAVGRYTFLFVDYDGERLHLMNDWHYMGEDVSSSCYNQFEVSTGGGAQRWVIRVYGDQRIEITLNGEEFSPANVDGAQGFTTSAQVPDREHTQWELSFPAAQGAWNVQLHDPGPTFNCENGELASEPVPFAGDLMPGGSTVGGDARGFGDHRLLRIVPSSGAAGDTGSVYASVPLTWEVPNGVPSLRLYDGDEAVGSAVLTNPRTTSLDAVSLSVVLDFTVPAVAAGTYDARLEWGSLSTNALPFVVTQVVLEDRYTISLFPQQGLAGTIVTASGAGLPTAVSPSVRFKQGGEVIGSAQASEQTASSVSFAVPAIAPGSYAVELDYAGFGDSNDVTFTLQAPPPTLLSLDPNSGEPGTSVTASGESWPSGNVTVLFYDEGNEGRGSAQLDRTDSTGSFTVPDIAAGTYTVALSFAGSETERIAFTVLAPTPRIAAFAPAVVAAGSSVTISGTLWPDLSPAVAVFSLDGDEEATAALSLNGAIAGLATFTVPQLAPGGYDVTVRFGDAGNGTDGGGTAETTLESAAVRLTVAPFAGEATFSPSFGVQGTPVTTELFEGWPAEAPTVRFVQGSLEVRAGSTRVDDTVTFPVPALEPGTYQVQLDWGVAGVSAPQTFTVIPVFAVELSPAGGAPGDEVSLTGAALPTSSSTVYFFQDGAMVTRFSPTASSASSVDFLVPAVPGGYYDVSVGWGVEGASSPVVFHVHHALTLSASFAAVAETVTASGAGWPTTAPTVHLVDGGGATTSTTAEIVGDDVVSFVVPDLSQGTYVVYLQWPDAQRTIDASLAVVTPLPAGSLEPAEGVIGATVTASEPSVGAWPSSPTPGAWFISGTGTLTPATVLDTFAGWAQLEVPNVVDGVYSVVLDWGDAGVSGAMSFRVIRCGNGQREGGEQCDDGASEPSDGCSATCTLETFQETEPNDSLGAANALGGYRLVRGFLDDLGSDDYFSILVGADGVVSATVNGETNLCDVPASLSLLNAEGTLVASAGVCNVDTNAAGALSTGALAAGSYYLRVKSAYPGTFPEPYVVSLTITNP